MGEAEGQAGEDEIERVRQRQSAHVVQEVQALKANSIKIWRESPSWFQVEEPVVVVV